MTISCLLWEKPSEMVLLLLSCLVLSSREGHVINGTSLSTIIQRDHFSNQEDVRVWVQAKNQHGSAKSQDKLFNTAEISESVWHILVREYRHHQ